MRLVTLVLLLLAFPAASPAQRLAPSPTEPPASALVGRERIRLDDGWRFALGHASDFARDFNHGTSYFSYLAKTGYGDGPASPSFDDRTWRDVRIPHDWGVELPFDPRGQASHGYKPLGRGFPETSLGWYRRTFHIPESDLGRRIRIEFDGVYRAARVFVNGFFVGEEPSGYLPVSYDVSEYLNYGGDNLVAVRVDATMPEGWYYEGAGIYRHAWLSKTSPLHVRRHGTWVRSEPNEDHSLAELRIQNTVTNAGRTPAAFTVGLAVFGPGAVPGRDAPLVELATTPSEPIAPGAERIEETSLTLRDPRLWDVVSPELYTLVTTILMGDREVDRTETRFGIRSIRFDPDRGFFLNGRHVLLKGTNNHQDHAGVGVAVPDALQEFRLRRLMEMGANTYRTAHHPPTPELLEACDRLGILVVNENRLMGVNDYHLGQLERLILRDRNHPSVILWSIGNEEWAIEGNIKGARITVPMQDFVHRIDPTRPVSAAISGGWGGISREIEVPGVNYVRQADVDRQHREFPWQAIVGTEETTTQGTRGIYFDDRERAHLSPQEDGSSGGNAESGLRFYAERPFAAGVIYWTGFDYRGEPTPFGWPAIGTQFGILDTCGFPKDGFHYLRAWWTDEPVLHVFPHWNWPGREGTPIEVRVHSNHDEVELLHNGTSLGRQSVRRLHHLKWTVPYAPGRLEARGFRDGRQVATTIVETTGEPTAVALVPDRTTIAADGRDVAVFTVEARDAAGRLVPTAALRVAFAVSGPGRVIGVGNGDPSCHEPDVFFASVRGEKLGTWQAPDASIREGALSFEATFDRPTLTDGEHVTLLLAALGPAQTVTLNDTVLHHHAAPAALRAPVSLDLAALRPTGNTIRIEAPARYTDWGARETLFQIHPAVLRFSRPAPQWTRSTFNGLAQVIVQSTGEPGTITLHATSPDASAAESSITAR
ncbi:beta-galactosidase GalA [Opitutales bacterium ASA1]|uniref:beta-galactosidase GalA n=1 Tax=Congregicoccus parvus TaxID=3081749 RepID=UPI002B2F3DD2|nr:beta-galactosidase GalA [Opitutales bacterium ASA1]